MVFIRNHLMNSSCVDCGEDDLVVLEFDHVGMKTGDVCRLAVSGCSLRRLKSEIDECEVRCANCHRARTREVLAGDPFA